MFNKNKTWKKVVAGALGIIMMASLLPVTNVEAALNTESEKAYTLPFRDLSVDEMVAEMGTGWNLGNTMDGHTGFTPNETLWQNVETTQILIDQIHDQGFNTVRIPVTWGTMIDDENGYAINEAWISRVQDIVDYCISQDMYVIINIHHDGAEQSGWLRVSSEDIDPVYDKFEGVWTVIAERFKNYDEHLIFESMNEITGGEDTEAGKTRDMEVINNLNQIFVDVVRASGSNNAFRWLLVPGRYTNIEVTTDPTYGFKLPTDTIANRIFVSVHYYDWTFGMVATEGKTTYSYENATSLAVGFKKLVDTFTSQGIPVILGEYGCINKDNPIERAYHVEIVNRLCQTSGVVACYWDQGWYDRTMTPDYSYTLVDRVTGITVDKLVTDAVMRGTFVKATTEDLSDVVKDVEVKEITEVALSTEVLNITIGDSEKITAIVTPEDTNDVLLWKTSDSSIATVYNGQVRGRGIGTAVLTAFSQSGSIEKTVAVTVNAEVAQVPATDIIVETSDYALVAGQSQYLNASVAPADTTEYITYKTTNKEIVSVSTLGKIVGKAPGTAYIVMTTSGGLTKTVKVTVTEASTVGALNLALNVYFNDETTSYFTNETGQPITITGDGQYTVVFDCATDLSANAQDAGVTGLNNLTAIYIKDDDVTKGIAKISPLETCNIVYDKIIVDGQELTINLTEPKSALKTSGIFDTNDPFNSWDGSAVNEVEVVDHVLNMAGISNPQKVEVTFTISDMVFNTANENTNLPVDTLEASTETALTLQTLGETAKVGVFVNPVETTEVISFVSSNAAVVAVDTTGLKADSTTGEVLATITALSSGTATITARSESGVEVAYEITVAESNTDQEAVTEADGSDQDKEKTDTKEDAKYSPGTIVFTIVLGLVIILVIGTASYRITRKRMLKKIQKKMDEEKK